VGIGAVVVYCVTALGVLLREMDDAMEERDVQMRWMANRFLILHESLAVTWLWLFAMVR
jgi:hypothetical protein